MDQPLASPTFEVPGSAIEHDRFWRAGRARLALTIDLTSFRDAVRQMSGARTSWLTSAGRAYVAAGLGRNPPPGPPADLEIKDVSARSLSSGRGLRTNSGTRWRGCQKSAEPVYIRIEKAHMMDSTPETRASLLIRVRDPADQAAWHEFVEIYRPLILRLARQKGMQDADADDVAQEVLVAVARAVEQREHDPKRAKFRTWLNRVAHNAILNALTRGRPDRGSGDSALLAVLNQHESHTGPDSDLLRLEYRREVFRWAVRQVRKEFHQPTWDAFWLTAVEGRAVEVVAKELAKNPGAIYAAAAA